MNGRSGRPFRVAVIVPRISVSSPDTWTVPAPRASTACQGIGSSRAPPTFSLARARVGGLAAGGAHAGDPARRGVDPLDRQAGAELATQLTQVADERVGQPLGATLGTRPAHHLAHQVQVDGRDCAARAAGDTVTVTARAVQPCSRTRSLEQPAA